MNIHYFQHESFEDLASIHQWANKPGNKITCTKFFEKHTLPDLDTIDLLIVLGGPMSVYEEDKYPWLKEEKKFIKKAILLNKNVLGICLGSQLIAEVLGAKVYKNKDKEIGWFEIQLTNQGKQSEFFENFPGKMKVFHWHGDTFDLPKNAVHVASSMACKNQAFTYGDNVVALQFHIEATKKLITELIENCREELVDAPFIQEEAYLLKNSAHLDEMNEKMFDILDKFQ